MLYLDDEEEQLILDYIYLEIIKRILASDYSSLESAGFKLQSYYLLMLDRVLHKVHQQQKSVRYLMQQGGVRVWINKEKSDSHFIQYNYHWKNKAEGFSCFSIDAMKMEANKRIKRLFKEVFNLDKG